MKWLREFINEINFEQLILEWIDQAPQAATNGMEEKQIFCRTKFKTFFLHLFFL